MILNQNRCADIVYEIFEQVVSTGVLEQGTSVIFTLF